MGPEAQPGGAPPAAQTGRCDMQAAEPRVRASRGPCPPPTRPSPLCPSSLPSTNKARWARPRASGVDNRSRKGPLVAGAALPRPAAIKDIPRSRAAWRAGLEGQGLSVPATPPLPGASHPLGASPRHDPQPRAPPPATGSSGRPGDPSPTLPGPPARTLVTIPAPRACGSEGEGRSQPGPPRAARRPSPRPRARSQPAGQLGHTLVH